MSNPKVRCPHCRNLSEYNIANQWRPFCCERCKMIDLGAWASDAYSIAGRAVEGDDTLDALQIEVEASAVPPPRSAQH